MEVLGCLGWRRWSEANIGGRVLDVASGALQPGTTLKSGTPGYPFERLGIAFDGTRYGVVFEQRPAYSTFNQYFQLYDPKSGLVGAPVQFGGPNEISTTHYLRYLSCL